MAEPWLLIAPGQLRAGATVELDASESRHAAVVLRLRPGDLVVLADGEGTTAAAILRSVAKRRAVAEVTEVQAARTLAGEGVEIALAVLNGRTMDWAVQKAVEVGVRRFVPVLTARSQPPPAAAGKRRDHWREVARQALKQCRRPWGMAIDEPVELAELVRRRSGRGGLVAHPGGPSALQLPPDHPRLLLVGPEGGLSVQEERLLDGAHWARVRLGPHVLRAETAAIVGAALLGLLADDL